MKTKIKYSELSSEDLQQRLRTTHEELVGAKRKLRMGQFKKTSDFGRMRREIARVNTIIRQRELKTTAKAK